MLRIRLSRTGRKNQPHYRIVVTEKKSKRDGGNADILGYYISYTNPGKLKIDVDKYEKWLEKGAQPTEVVASLRKKVKNSEEVDLPKTKKKKSKKAKAAEEAEAKKETEK